MEFYHVLNRGVDKRDIVLDDEDRVRFMHDVFVFNDSESTPNFIVKARRSEHTRKLLVRVHAFCLMRNHYHFLLSPLVDNGVSLFMKKLNMGYAKYFNEKYERSGSLWQGKYKKILVSRDAHFMYLPYYIHLNALDATHPNWRLGTVTKPAEALEELRKYRWSSHLDYLGESNFPSLTQREFLSDILGTSAEYEKEIKHIITSPSLASGSDQFES
jgi:putative transposase